MLCFNNVFVLFLAAIVSQFCCDQLKLGTHAACLQFYDSYGTVFSQWMNIH